MATTSKQPDQTFEACDRFFSIPELTTIFLEHCPVRNLLCCQRVCQTWNSIIQDSETLQQHLFLQAAPAGTTPIINPIIDEYFTILADSWNCYAAGNADRGIDIAYRRYKDLIFLPCARDGRLEHAPARRAFAREEASWRDMLVSQPPIRRLDWWHTWSSKAPDPDSQDDSYYLEGWGHQNLNDSDITIGMLWDLVESRMARGCGVRVLYFPEGKSMDNESSSSYAKEWWQDRTNQHRGLTEDMPRVEIQSMQTWDMLVTGREVFDMDTSEWVGPKGTQRGRHDYYGDGFNVLRNDCKRDYGEGVTVNGHEQNPLKRWSRSEAFFLAEIHGESSGWQ